MVSANTTNFMTPTVAHFLNKSAQGQIKIGHSFSTTSEKVLAAHEHLYLAGDMQSFVYQVLQGVVSVYELLPDGRRQISTFYYPGDLIGVDSPLRFDTNAECLCESRIRCIPLKAVERLIDNEPGFSHALLKMLAVELAETRDQLLSLGRKSALEKVATFFLRISRRNEREGSNELLLHLPMTRAEIADYLGLTIETVSRNITKLKKAGAVEVKQSGWVSVNDMVLLESFANVRPH